MCDYLSARPCAHETAHGSSPEVLMNDRELCATQRVPKPASSQRVAHPPPPTEQANQRASSPELRGERSARSKEPRVKAVALRVEPLCELGDDARDRRVFLVGASEQVKNVERHYTLRRP